MDTSGRRCEVMAETDLVIAVNIMIIIMFYSPIKVLNYGIPMGIIIKAYFNTPANRIVHV